MGNKGERIMDYEYVITSANDGQAPHWTQRYEQEFGAWENFFLFTDHGMASEYRTVNLYTPTGKCYTKIFYRGGKVKVVA
jgi:hypothetical protein